MDYIAVATFRFICSCCGYFPHSNVYVCLIFDFILMCHFCCNMRKRNTEKEKRRERKRESIRYLLRVFHMFMEICTFELNKFEIFRSTKGWHRYEETGGSFKTINIWYILRFSDIKFVSKTNRIISKIFW